MQKFIKPVIASIAIGIFGSFIPRAAAQGYQIRRAIEKKYEKKYEDEYGKEGKAKGNSWLDNLSNVKLKEVYLLSQSITYVSVPYKKGEPNERKIDTIKLFSNAKDDLIGMQASEGKEASYSIMDLKESAQITVFPAKKEMMAINAKALMSKKMQESLKESNEDNDGKNKLKPNGKTKTILGYKCIGYTLSDEDEIIAQYFIYNLASFKNAKYLSGGLSNGLGNVMEHTEYKNGTITKVMTAISENKNENLAFKTSDYKQLGFGKIE